MGIQDEYTFIEVKSVHIFTSFSLLMLLFNANQIVTRYFPPNIITVLLDIPECLNERIFDFI